ncbi:MAG: 50S ribosomal protein L6 [Chloroflexi bacterium]|nr:MAG: 50S ribosomal protein L6 [Chloroflexota bacterium]
MSRIGKLPIPLPDKVTVDIKGQRVTVKGPKGELSLDAHPDMTVALEDGQIVVKRPTDLRHHRALHGLTRALIANMVTGVSEGFRKTLVIEGVGYQAEMRGKDLVLKVGFSHEVVVNPPEGITFDVPKESRGRTVHIDGIDKQLVGQVAANIRKWRPPEPYKGKGIRYADEVIRRKAGKTKA